MIFDLRDLILYLQSKEVLKVKSKMEVIVTVNEVPAMKRGTSK